jgi:hypothetical protein
MARVGLHSRRERGSSSKMRISGTCRDLASLRAIISKYSGHRNGRGKRSTMSHNRICQGNMDRTMAPIDILLGNAVLRKDSPGRGECIQRTTECEFFYPHSSLFPPKNCIRELAIAKLFLVESYRPGYPRFSALIAAHDSFYVSRRFSTLRSRLLFVKQDKLSVLEEKLQAIDKEEPAALFLGKSRLDTNQERLSVLAEIDSTMADYGMAGIVAACDLLLTVPSRFVCRADMPNAQPQDCTLTDHKESAKLGARQWMHSSRGNRVLELPQRIGCTRPRKKRSN